MGIVPLAASETAPDARIELGRALFFDRALSSDGSVSCASCHKPERGFGDNVARSQGASGQTTIRNTPTLREAANYSAFAWDGRQSRLEEQVLEPLVNPREHGMPHLDDVVRRVEDRPEYRARFARLREQIGPEAIGKALAAYVQSLGNGRSSFDRFVQGEVAALSPQERRGLEIFRGAGQCATCHRIEGPRPSFTDSAYHAVFLSPLRAIDLGEVAHTAVRMDAAERLRRAGTDDDVAKLGRFNATLDPRDIGAFRTPSLRNVAMTSPYMHDGSVESLKDAVEFELYYRNSRHGRPTILTTSEKADLVSFLNALTDEHDAKSPH